MVRAAPRGGNRAGMSCQDKDLSHALRPIFVPPMLLQSRTSEWLAD